MADAEIKEPHEHATLAMAMRLQSVADREKGDTHVHWGH